MVKPQDFDSSTYFKARVKNNLGSVFYSSMFTRASASTIGSASRHHHHRQQRQRRQCRQQMNLCIGQIEASTCPPPPGHTPGIWHLCRPGEEGIWLSESSRGWGIWSPCFRGGEFELHHRFHVKSLAWRAIMGDAELEDFRGKDCAFVVNWLRGKGLNKFCAVFEVFKF